MKTKQLYKKPHTMQVAMYAEAHIFAVSSATITEINVNGSNEGNIDAPTEVYSRPSEQTTSDFWGE